MTEDPVSGRIAAIVKKVAEEKSPEEIKALLAAIKEERESIRRLKEEGVTSDAI